MTCIVGVIEPKEIHIGADSSVTSGYTKYELPPDNGKLIVVKKPKMLMGVSGDIRALQIIRHCFRAPIKTRGEDIPKYLNTKFIGSIRKVFKTEGAIKIISSKEYVPMQMLVVTTSGIYKVSSDLAVTGVLDRYAAIGSGEEAAIGSLYTSSLVNSYLSKELKMPVVDRIEAAIKAASKYCHGVDDNILTMSLKG